MKSFWVLNCWMNKGSNVKTSLCSLGHCDEHFSHLFDTWRLPAQLPALIYTLFHIHYYFSIHFTDMHTLGCMHFCWTASAHVSFILTLPPKQLDFVDPPKDREGKSAQDSTWGNSLADDCKVVGWVAAGGSASGSSMPALAVDSLC